MSQRPLSSSSITPSTLSALTRAGYQTFQDLSASSAEALSKGQSDHIELLTELYPSANNPDLNIPLPASQALFASTLPSKLPLIQSAAELTTTAHKFSTHCSPIDKLLNGGLTRGHILEVSGPPGTMKEAVAIGVVRSFVERREEVLFVGESIQLRLECSLIMGHRHAEYDWTGDFD
jgi:RAD51-like protein 2